MPASKNTTVWTESMMLERIWNRYGTKKSLGDAPRFMVAEHPRTALGDRNNRILDALVIDRHRTYADGYVYDPTLGYRVPAVPMNDFHVLGFEVKVSRGDFLREVKDLSKAEAWSRYCSHFYVVAPRDMLSPAELPSEWGLMVPRGNTLTVVKKAVETVAEPMPAPVVAAVMLAGARTEARRGRII